MALAMLAAAGLLILALAVKVNAQVAKVGPSITVNREDGVIYVTNALIVNFQTVGTNCISTEPIAKQHIQTMRDDGSLTNVVKLLVESGEFCQIHGHAWGSHTVTTLLYRPDNPQSRECKICGKVQERTQTEWK